MHKLLFSLSILTAAAGAVNAAPIVTIAVNTSSIAGTTGSLDFQFNPGPLNTQPATVQILNFTGGTFAGGQQLSGGVTGGPLPGSVTINNSGALNEYFEPFHFGSSLSFTLAFSGPAITSPNGISTSGSIFDFSIFSDAAGTTPILTSDPGGLAATVAVNLNGSLTTSVISPNAQIVPEPGSLSLLSAVFLLGTLVLLGSTRLRGRSLGAQVPLRTETQSN